eukprot:scaffold37540_cov28-Tisochrysis_lutea.AAC.3
MPFSLNSATNAPNVAPTCALSASSAVVIRGVARVVGALPFLYVTCQRGTRGRKQTLLSNRATCILSRQVTSRGRCPDGGASHTWRSAWVGDVTSVYFRVPAYFLSLRIAVASATSPSSGVISNSRSKQ